MFENLGLLDILTEVTYLPMLVADVGDRDHLAEKWVDFLTWV